MLICLTPKESIDTETGEAVIAFIIHITEKSDEDHFVNVFTDSVKAAFDLTTNRITFISDHSSRLSILKDDRRLQ